MSMHTLAESFVKNIHDEMLRDLAYNSFIVGYKNAITWGTMEAAPHGVNLLIQMKDGSSEIDCYPFEDSAEYWTYIPTFNP